MIRLLHLYISLLCKLPKYSNITYVMKDLTKTCIHAYEQNVTQGTRIYINATWYVPLVVYVVNLKNNKNYLLTCPHYTHMHDEMVTLISQITNQALTTDVLLFDTMKLMLQYLRQYTDLQIDIAEKAHSCFLDIGTKTNSVSKGAKIRNRYNQVPHLTQDTNWKVTNSDLDTTNEGQEVSLSQQVTTKQI